MNSYDFKNQVAVVTGGANGIGFSVAERLSKSGASVKIWDLETKHEINSKSISSTLFLQVCTFLFVPKMRQMSTMKKL